MLIQFEIMKAQNGFIGKLDDQLVIGKDENEVASEIARLANEKKTDFQKLAYIDGSTCGNYQILHYVTKKTTIIEGWMKSRDGENWLTMGNVECSSYGEAKEITRRFIADHFPGKKAKKVFHSWKGEVLEQY